MVTNRHGRGPYGIHLIFVVDICLLLWLLSLVMHKVAKQNMDTIKTVS